MQCKVGVDMVDRSQLMRGTLEGSIVKIISMKETYGYEIVSKLQSYGFEDAKEGTIYPILIRLEKKNIISSTYKISPLGPKRKYYFLTETGEIFLREFKRAWEEVKNSVDNIMGGDLSNV